MFNCKMIINRLHIEDARMEIGVAINCPFDVDVSLPKRESCLNVTDRPAACPLRVVNYFRQSRRGAALWYATIPTCWTRSFTTSSRKAR